jgi:hypothetical protein
MLALRTTIVGDPFDELGPPWELVTILIIVLAVVLILLKG